MDHLIIVGAYSVGTIQFCSPFEIAIFLTDFFCPSSGEIEGQLYDRKMVDKSIQNMQNDMLKLNQLLTREGKIRQDLHQDNALIENDFVLSLRVSLPHYTS